MSKVTSYKMPAEWEPHEGTWIAWPHNKRHWPGNFEPIPRLYAEMVKALAESEKVFICINDKKAQKEAEKILHEKKVTKKQLKNIKFFKIRTNSTWTRDYGAIFVRDEKGKLVITDWIFNAWGEKYPPWESDDIVPQKIGKIFKTKVVKPEIILEGGSIEVNGKGVLLTTEECIFARNPKLSRKQIEGYFKKYLGIEKTLWLGKGATGDETDGHIDAIARFVNPKTIACVVEKNPKDANYKTLKKNFEELKKMTDQEGKPFKIIALPTPKPVMFKGQKLPANYANFYIGNTIVLIPTFGCEQDQEVKKILSKFFPTRKMVGIDCKELVWGYGAFHCSTQQHPKE